MIRTLFPDDPAARVEIERIINRSPYDKKVEPLVRRILEDVRQRGDEAILEYTLRFDGVRFTPGDLRVAAPEIEAAAGKVAPAFKEALAAAKARIEEFHERELRNSWITEQSSGTILGQLFRPLESVGIYVPGGTAGYPSSVLMNAVPAGLAGVARPVIVTPPGKDGNLDPHVLFAAATCGIREIYKVGGAQAIGALAFGSETIPKVDKIVGPGNSYVTLAKKLVYGEVEIDMLAGPSEILILADARANPSFIAADLLSQAEHDPLASSILITSSQSLATEVEAEVKRQLGALTRKDVISSALNACGAIIIVRGLKEGIELANRLAPEHLEIMVKDPLELLSQIKNAGAVFLGEYSPVPLGDYIAGPNHVLPTGGAARFSSPLGVEDFLKRTSLVACTKAGLKAIGGQARVLAEIEGFTAHANSIKLREEGNNEE